jgi:hypothetical protein
VKENDMSMYLTELVAREHVSDLLAQASRQRLRRASRRSRRERASVAPAAEAAVYCRRAAAPARRAVA